MSQINGSGISIDPREHMNFAMNSEMIYLPTDNYAKREVLRRDFYKSCMIVRVGNTFYIGELNSVNEVGYSMIINGEEKKFSFSETEAIFKPKLC